VSKCEKVKLDNICVEKIQTISPKDDYNIEYVDISSIDNQEKKIVSYQTIHSKDAPSRAKQILKKNDILVSTVRPNLNAVAINQIESKNVVVGSTGYCVLRCTKDIDVNYLFNYCKSNAFINRLVKLAKGASYPAVSNLEVKNSKIPLPPLETQKQIAKTLNIAAELLAMRKQQLAELDNLIKSTFYKMFGDPITNEKGWELVSFTDVLILQRGFDLPVQNRVTSGKVPVYGSNGILDFHNEPKIKNGGVITGRSGTIGKVFYTFSDYWPLNTTLFSVDIKGNNIIFLAYLLQFYNLGRFCSGTGVPTLNRNIVHNEKIYKIPLNKQNQFAEIVTKIEQQKVLVQKAIDETQYLFDSLMSEYFGE
jgi:type I restriction enzyme S subunit